MGQMYVLSPSGEWDIIWRWQNMIYRLRVKFVVINMTIVVLMMSVVFGLVYHLQEQIWKKRASA